MESLDAWWIRAVALLLLVGGSLYVVHKRIAHYRRLQSQQESLARSLLASQERERQRIAAELHDGLGQILLLIKNRALLVLEGPRENLDVHFQLEETSRVASQSIEEIREIARNLRPYQLDRLGLTKALQAAVRNASQSCGIQLTHEIEAMDLGVKGYVLKESAAKDVIAGIETVMRGHHFVSSTISECLVDRRGEKPALEDPPLWAALTRRKSAYCAWWRTI